MKSKSKSQIFLRWMLSFSLIMTSESMVLAAQSEAINDLKSMVKKTGWTKEQKLSDFLPKIKSYVHPKIYNRLQSYSDLNPGAQVPKIEVQKLNENGKVKVLFNLQNKTESLELNLSNSRLSPTDKIAKINNQTVSYEDVFYSDKWSQHKPSKLLTFSEIKELYKKDSKLTEDYFKTYSQLIAAFDEYYRVNTSGKFSDAAMFYAPWWMNQAFAQGKVKTKAKSDAKSSAKSNVQLDYSKDGSPCVVAGHLSKVSKGSCGGQDPSEFKGSCEKNQLSCSPLVFGFNGQSNPFCVPQKPADQVSVKCDQQSNSYYAAKESPNKNCEVKGRDKVLCNLVGDVIAKCDDKQLEAFTPCQPDAYIKELQEHIEVAFGQCSPIEAAGKSLSFADFKSKRSADVNFRLQHSDIKKTWTGGKAQAKSDIHHQKACATLLNRFMDLEKEAMLAQAVIDDTMGDVWPVTILEREPIKEVVVQEAVKEQPAAPIVESKPSYVAKENEDDTSFWPFLLIAGLVACVAYFCKNDGGSSEHPPMPTIGKLGEPVRQRSTTPSKRPLPATPKAAK